MSGLAVGLAVGFAAAGGVGGFTLSLASGFVGAFLGGLGMKTSEPSPIKDGLIGAFAGAVIGGGLGLAIDAGLDYANRGTATPTPITTTIAAPAVQGKQPSALLQACYDSAQAGDSVIFEQNVGAAPTCRVIKGPAVHAPVAP